MVLEVCSTVARFVFVRTLAYTQILSHAGMSVTVSAQPTQILQPHTSALQVLGVCANLDDAAGTSQESALVVNLTAGAASSRPVRGSDLLLASAASATARKQRAKWMAPRLPPRGCASVWRIAQILPRPSTPRSCKPGLRLGRPAYSRTEYMS